MTEKSTILHHCSPEVVEMCKQAHEAATHGNEILQLISTLIDGIKEHLNTIHREAFVKACEEYPQLADQGNPCQLDYEHGFVYLPSVEAHPAHAFHNLMKAVAEGAGGKVLAAGTPEDLLQQLQGLMAQEATDEDDKKNNLN